MQNNTKKYLVVGVVVLMILLGVSAISGNKAEKKSLGEKREVSPANNSGSSVSVEKCPEGQVKDEKTGVCKGTDNNNEASVKGKEVSMVDILQADYRNVLRGYKEYFPSKNMNGANLYYRILSFTPEKELTFSVGYLDDNQNWTENKRYVSDKTGNALIGFLYYGKLLKLDNPDYYCTENSNFAVTTSPVKVILGGMFQCNDVEGRYLASENTEIKTVILNSGKEQSANNIAISEAKNEYNIYAYPYMELPIAKNPTDGDTTIRSSWGEVRKTTDGFPSYYRILSYKGEGYNQELTVSFGYIKDSKWVEYKRFASIDENSEECGRSIMYDSRSNNQGSAGKFCGTIAQTDYKYFINGFDVLTGPPRLDLTDKYFKRQDFVDGKLKSSAVDKYRMMDDPERTMIVLQ